MATSPEGFRHHTPIAIRYGDMDTLGHVNNAKYLTYVEQARIAYVRGLNLWEGDATELGLIVAKITIEYKSALTLTDRTVDVWTRCSRLGNRSFNMQHQMTAASDSRLAAVVEVVVVAFNYTVGEPVVIPDTWRSKITEYEPMVSH